jgi:hypothetical protein
VGNDRIEKLAAANRSDRLVDALRLLIESSDGEHVLIGRLFRRIELRVGVWHSQIGLLHRCVEHVPTAQLEPRRERLRVPLLGGVRPAGAEQCLVRLRTFEAHALQNILRVVGATRFEPRVAEREVRFVTQRGQLFGRRLDLADCFEQLRRVVQALLAHQRDADVEAGVR